MTNELVYIKTVPGQLVYDAIAEAITDGKLPADARLGPIDYGSAYDGKPMFVKENEEILGSVCVRPHESFYIIRKKNS